MCAFCHHHGWSLCIVTVSWLIVVWWLSFFSGSSRNIYIQGYALIGAVAFGSGITQSISVAVLAIEMTGTIHPFFHHPLHPFFHHPIHPFFHHPIHPFIRDILIEEGTDYFHQKIYITLNYTHYHLNTPINASSTTPSKYPYMSPMPCGFCFRQFGIVSSLFVGCSH